jgi:hypothetical protein
MNTVTESAADKGSETVMTVIAINVKDVKLLTTLRIIQTMIMYALSVI